MILVRQKIYAPIVVTNLMSDSLEEAHLLLSNSHSCGRKHHRSFSVVILRTHQARDAMLAPRFAKASSIEGEPIKQGNTER